MAGASRLGVNMLLRSWFFILICLFSGHSLADTVWLDNGDRLSGRIELIEGGRLVMATELAGTVTVSVSRIRTLESERGLLIKTHDHAERALSLRASETPGEVLLVNGAVQSLALRDIRQLLEPRPLIEDWQWSGKAAAALDVKQADSDTRDLDISVDTKARHGDWRHELGYEFERDFRNEQKSRHVWEAEYDLSWFFADKWFWQTSLGYRRDFLEEVARRRQLGVGPGYEWWNNSLGHFETAARLGHLRLDRRDGSAWHASALALEWDYRRFLFGKRFELYHTAETLIPDASEIRWSVDAELGLRYLLNSWASLSLIADWDYLNATDGSDINYRRYRLGMGINW